MAIRGSCLCGAVTFRIEKARAAMEICHCNRCRKATGSASAFALPVNVADYRLLTGHALIRSYSAPILHEPPAYRTFFCNVCGSPVPDPDPSGEWFEIPVGVLDGDPGVKPDKHIFVELVPAWDRITDDLPRYTLPELLRHRAGRFA